VRLVLQRVLSVAQRLAVQCAPAAARKVGVVEEHARTLGSAGRGAQRRLLPVDGVHLGVVLEALAVVLPGLRGEQLGGRAYPLLAVGVGEERAVRAASVAGTAGHDAVAAATEYARPRGREPGEVGPDHVLVVGRIDELDVLAGKVEPDLAAARLVDVHRNLDGG